MRHNCNQCGRFLTKSEAFWGTCRRCVTAFWATLCREAKRWVLRE